ncbi:MAG: glycosyltransferase family 87 protein [Candidatus Dormibacterales bacterium]
MRLDAQALRNLGGVGLAWFLVIVIGLTGWFVVVVPLRADILDNDLTLVYIGVRIGLEHGWSHIYSLDLQHQLFTQLRPTAAFNDGERFVSPPPLAWLVLPLSIFGAAGAVYLFLAGSLVALAAAWWIAAPGAGWQRSLWLAGALAWYPVLYSLAYAQPDLLVLFVVAASWRLAVAGRAYLAGAVLGLSVVKPQLTLVLPFVLLAAGRWRIAAGWAAGAGLLALVSLAMIGTAGVSDYQSLLREAQGVTNNRYFTLAYIVGPGWLSYAAQLLITLIGVTAAYLRRHADTGRLYALGIVTTALGATYWHLQDFSILVLAAWLFWRDNPPAWQRWCLAIVVIGGELAWPLKPLPVLFGVALWLAFLISDRRPAGATSTVAAAT